MSPIMPIPGIKYGDPDSSEQTYRCNERKHKIKGLRALDLGFDLGCRIENE